MAIEATITGNLGADPEVRWTQGGQQALHRASGHKKAPTRR